MAIHTNNNWRDYKHYSPNKHTNFTQRDTLSAIISNTHNLYENKPGHTLASLIWDHFLKYVLGCRSKNVTLIAAIAVHEIRSQVNEIPKLPPNTMASKHISLDTEL